MNPQSLIITEIMSEALLFLQRNELSLAEDSYASALSLCDQHLPSNSKQTTKCLECLGKVSNLQGNVGMSTLYYEQLLKILRDNNENSDFDVDLTQYCLVLGELGGIYRIVGRGDEVEVIEREEREVMLILNAKYSRDDGKDGSEDDESEENEDDSDDSEENRGEEGKGEDEKDGGR